MSAESLHFKKGDKVEVLKREKFSIWFPAAVLRPSVKRNDGAGQIYVEFETLCADDDPAKRRKEYVHSSSVRPAPPREMCCYFKVGDTADVLYELKGWREGTVDEILENSVYVVALRVEDGEEEGDSVKAEQWQLRVHRDWKDGSWDPPLQPQADCHPQQYPQNISKDSVITASGVKLRIKCTSRSLVRKFGKEKLVEVKHDKEGVDISWYAAVVMKVLENGKFLVQYQTLKSENGIEFLTEEVDATFVRPYPREIERINPFEYLDRVDAWFNKGWWEGYVWEVSDDMKYVVCLGSANEFSTFEHSNLRPHQDWINNKWVAATKFDLPRSSNAVKANLYATKLKIRSDGKASVPTFSKGMIVEATSFEEGYHGSWFTAVIFDTIEEENRYVLEYQTLKTDDESEPLKEKADAFNIRPCPPVIERLDRFKMFEEVDAWYNDGWWEGLISKVLAGLKYVVYFWNTNEEIEFEHHGIRPHQEWVDGKWEIAFRKSNKLPNPKLGMMKRFSTGIVSCGPFYAGTKVEVKDGDENQGRSWYYPAFILRPIGNDKYMVEFRTLKYDHANELLIDVADALCIRPSPPILQRTDQYRPLEEVDAWFSNGWRAGQVCNVLEDGRYSVCFGTANELLEVRHNGLRPHREWINGTWVNSQREVDLQE